MRRRWLVGGLAAATVLTACGSGDVVPGFLDSSSGTRTPPCALPPSPALSSTAFSG